MAQSLRRLLAPRLLAPVLALAVAAPALAEDPPLMFGVNLSGGDATSNGIPGNYGWDYIYPNEAEFDYYKSKGLELIRLPIKWRRIQHSTFASLDSFDMDKIDEVVGFARERDMKIIIDLHDYLEYQTSGGTYRVGTPQVPTSALVDLWGKLAAHFEGEPAIFGYDIMNEPKGTAAAWKVIAQDVIDEIRLHDSETWILIEGINHSRSWGWVKDGNDILKDLVDPEDKLIFSAHSYFDPDGSGRYQQNYAQANRHPQVGIDKVSPFVNWCNDNGVRGLIGEYGIPWNDGYVDEWNEVLDNFLAYLQANNIGGTYWCGGPWMGSYHLSCEPDNNFTVDKPVMSILEKYGSASGTIVDNDQASLTGSWASSSSSSGYYGDDYLHDGETGQGKAAVFTPNLPDAGSYQVSLNWAPAQNRATNAPVTIDYDGGSITLPVDQTEVTSWKPLGVFPFQAGTSGSVTVANTSANGFVIADAVKFTPVAGLPSGWANGDVGAVGVAGEASHSGGVFTVTGSGATIGGTADSFHFAHQTVSGDCTITAEVTSQTHTHGYARAGVMIRDGLDADAKFVDAIITPSHGGYLQYRSSTGASATSVSGGAAVASYWVRVTRVGNDFTAYKSSNGTSWTQMGPTKTVTMGASVKIGLAVCSYANSSLGTATFENVTITTP